MRIARVVLIAFVLGVASSTAAQTTPAIPASPGIGWVQQDGGWLPPGHPGIRPPAPALSPLDACVAEQPPGSTPLDLFRACAQHLPRTVVPGCEQVNAYAEPDRAADCAARSITENPPAKTIKTFTLGHVYGRPYGERTILIIGRALGIDGVEVITAQVVHPARERGTPVAFLNDGGITAGQWWPVTGGGQ
ncbi:MAG: hypothetical protein IPO08_21710 [Xanthomonadales bacterium]|nr:hypothetical protein [Xanthomonadales bacterium]